MAHTPDRSAKTGAPSSRRFYRLQSGHPGELGRLVAEHRLEDEAFDVALDLTVNLARKAYKLYAISNEHLNDRP